MTLRQKLEQLIASWPDDRGDKPDTDYQRGYMAAAEERARELKEALAEDAGGWRPIAEAPMDGTIITAAGWDWGRVGGRRHIHNCSWQCGMWVDVTNCGSVLAYLTDYHVGSSIEPPPPRSRNHDRRG